MKILLDADVNAKENILIKMKKKPLEQIHFFVHCSVSGIVDIKL